MSSSARHRHISVPVSSRLRWRSRAVRRIAGPWRSARAAVRSCSPERARFIAFRVTLVFEAAILAARGLDLVPKRFTQVMFLVSAAGLLALLVTMDIQLKMQVRQQARDRDRREALLRTLGTICDEAGFLTADGEAVPAPRRPYLTLVKPGTDDAAG